LDWKQEFLKAGVDEQGTLFSSITHEENLPWDFIEPGK